MPVDLLCAFSVLPRNNLTALHNSLKGKLNKRSPSPLIKNRRFWISAWALIRGNTVHRQRDKRGNIVKFLLFTRKWQTTWITTFCFFCACWNLEGHSVLSWLYLCSCIHLLGNQGDRHISVHRHLADIVRLKNKVASRWSESLKK